MIELLIARTGTIKWWNGPNLSNRYGPAEVWSDGDYKWSLRGLSHRTNGPASCINGNVVYYITGSKHRLDGPAIKYPNGHKEYWVDGFVYRDYLEYLVAVEEYNLNRNNYND